MTDRTRLTATLLLALAFLVGNLTGMALEEAMGIDWFEFLDEDYDEGEDQLLAGLDLTRDQRQRAEVILERQEDLLEDYWTSRLPEIDSILGQSYGEIRALLTPEQQSLFDERMRALDGRLPAELID